METINANIETWIRGRLPNDLAEKIEDKGDRDMSQTQLNVFFKMQQKDDKKEILKFEIKGQEEGDESTTALYALAGSIILFEIEGCAAGETSAEFMNIQRDSKKTAMKFAIKGDSERKAQELYKYAWRNVNLYLKASQMSIEEFYEDHVGLDYQVNENGNVEMCKNQMRLHETL
ncbi:hypothetical protein R3398_17190 [Rossellomorea marisflavi]|uniref:hypothetical protein n=1 Tax=Rossellomorea marisflavi TaxID=189381 RepID=UPI00296EDA0A|nr:hypothetical protein [Rossellomorea marisflavi]MDW4528104.1 hypothetical protein [Rossellomorea marisflavi]